MRKIVCLKRSWSQPVKQGWSTIPADICCRFGDGSKFEWCDLMAHVEEVFGALYSVASTVIAQSAVAECDKLKKMTCWVSTVEVDVMTLIFQSENLPRKNT